MEHSNEDKCKAFFTLGNYMDSLYQALVQKLQSVEWISSIELRKHKEKELAKCKQLLEQPLPRGGKANDKLNKQELQRHVIS